MVRFPASWPGRRIRGRTRFCASASQGNARSWPIVHRDLRRLLLERFPHSLYYRLTDSTIEVRACLHQRRKSANAASAHVRHNTLKLTGNSRNARFARFWFDSPAT